MDGNIWGPVKEIFLKFSILRTMSKSAPSVNITQVNAE